MKKYITYCASLLALAALSACSDTFAPGEEGDGEGRLMIRATVNSDVRVESRAAATNDELAASTKIWISNAKGAVMKFNSFSEVPAAGIKLLSGSYIAEAWAGDSVSASWDKRFFKAREEFQITKGGATQVNLDCKIENTLVSALFDDKVTSLLSDITLEVGHDKETHTKDGTLTFTQENIERGDKAYFMTNSRSKDLLYTIRGTLTSSDKPFEFSGRIENVKRATEYRLKVKHNDQASENYGGALFIIEVDETEIEVEDKIEIVCAPVIRGIGFNIDEPVTGLIGNFTRKSLWITSAAEINTLNLQGDLLNAVIPGLSGNDFEYFGMTETVGQTIRDGGVTIDVHKNAETGATEIKLSFETLFLNRLTEGTHNLQMRVADTDGRTTVKTISFVATNAMAAVDRIDFDTNLGIRSRSALLTGTVLREEAVNPGLMCREKGLQQWTKVPAMTSKAVGDKFTVELTNLKPATTYQVAAYSDGFESSDISEFTTEAEAQLPNAGMEDWCTDPNEKNVIIPGKSPSDFFWDSGNHGSITMKKNITVSDATVKHSGNYSVKLCSQFVGMGIIGKFAAGNIFIGKYLKTDGTDGVLGWGRTFTSRPSKLRVWAKYTPAKVTDADEANTDGVKKGDMDKGIIYVALVDNTKTEYAITASQKEAWPVVVKTKKDTRSLFNKNGSQVIAYGEHVFTEATSGDGLVEIIIPIDYKRTDIRPSNIVVVASASKMGDYFTGGPSEMYLDDFELIYE